jgi:hypothetical protein
VPPKKKKRERWEALFLFGTGTEVEEGKACETLEQRGV